MAKVYSARFANEYLHFVHAVCMCVTYDHVNKVYLQIDLSNWHKFVLCEVRIEYAHCKFTLYFTELNSVYILL